MPIDQQERYVLVSVGCSPDATDQDITDLRSELTDPGYTCTTVDDQLGSIKTVIDGIVLVLNACAMIALLGAGFAIVNTLCKSVQERTREIGLMKARAWAAARSSARPALH